MRFSVFLEETVFLLADKWRISPFEILEKDIDDLFFVLEHIYRKQENNDPKPAERQNDGFWDF